MGETPLAAPALKAVQISARRQSEDVTAVRLRNGNTLISDQYNDQVIEINSEGEIVFDQGEINTDGNSFDLLSAPYDAKVIGDYTGLTPPKRGEDEGDNDENE